MSDDRATLADAVTRSKIRKVRVLAWRDLEDPEAGGSELHMDEVLRRWAQAGLVIEARTSEVPGKPRRVIRHGYSVDRRAGRYMVFPGAFWRGLTHDRRSYDALFEIWNGIPFLGPLWFRGPRLTLIHHVHSAMWKMSLPRPLAAFGWWIEHRFSPIFYRKDGVVTVSQSSALEINEMLGISRTAVVPNGISSFFSPGAERSPTPLVVAVGRLVPVKRIDVLVREFVKVHDQVPNAQFVIAGDGYLRDEIEMLVKDLGATNFISLPGRISDDELLDLYRRAWIVSSYSQREGWGMSITEAAACGTPSVVVDISGHRDSVASGISGILVSEDDSLAEQIVNVLTNDEKRDELSRGALEFSKTLSWDAAALRLFELLEDGVTRRA